MPNYRGPVDDHIEAVTDILIRNRGTLRSSFSSDDDQRFRRAITELERYVVRSSLFATRDIKLIDAIFFDILDGFRGYIGGLGWIRGSKWLLAMVSRVKNQGITASGKMFVEMRERIKKVPESNRKDPGNWPPIKLEPELQELVFSELFPPSVCALSSRGRGKSPQMLRMTMCVNGCDLLLLQKLHFHEIVIARILGLKRTICSDRLFQCSAAVQNARISSSRSQAAPR